MAMCRLIVVVRTRHWSRPIPPGFAPQELLENHRITGTIEAMETDAMLLPGIRTPLSMVTGEHLTKFSIPLDTNEDISTLFSQARPISPSGRYLPDLQNRLAASIAAYLPESLTIDTTSLYFSYGRHPCCLRLSTSCIQFSIP